MNPSDVPAAAPLGGAPKAVPALPSAVPEKLLAARGKIAAAPFAEFSPAAWKSAGAVFADGCGVALGTSVFENVSAPLAAAGTPWDAARERIARELAFWFGSEEFSAVPAENLSAEQRTRLALARAFAGKPAGAPLAVAGTLPHLAPLTDALKIRAKKENIAVVVENAPEKIFRAADLLAFFPDSSEAASGGVPAFCSPQEAESAPPTLFAAVQFRSARTPCAGTFSPEKFSGRAPANFSRSFPAERKFAGGSAGTRRPRTFPRDRGSKSFFRRKFSARTRSRRKKIFSSSNPAKKFFPRERYISVALRRKAKRSLRSSRRSSGRRWKSPSAARFSRGFSPKTRSDSLKRRRRRRNDALRERVSARGNQ